MLSNSEYHFKDNNNASCFVVVSIKSLILFMEQVNGLTTELEGKTYK